MSLAEDLARATRGSASVEAFYASALAFFCARWEWPLGQALELREDPGGSVLGPARAWHASDRDSFRSFRELTESIEMPADRGPSGTAVHTGRPVWIPDLTAAVATADDPRHSTHPSAGLRGVLVLPIVSAGATVGVLELHDVRPRPSDPGILGSIRDLPVQLGWLRSLAARIEETDRTRSRMQGLVEAMEAIGASGLTPEEVMQVTAERIQTLAGATSAGVYEVPEEEPSTLVMIGGSGNAVPFKGLKFNMDETVTGYAFQHGEVVLVNDVRTDPRVNQEIVEETTRSANLRAFVAVPLIGEEGRPVALLNVMSNRTNSFTEDDVDLLRLLSRHMGSALDRARAAEANRRLLTELRRTTEALKASLQRTEAILDASLHPIVVLDPEDRVVLWSQAAERLYGWTGEEILGRRVPFFPEDRLEQGSASLRRVRGGEVLHNVDVIHRTRDGSSVEVRISATPITVRADESGVVLVVTDMTEIRSVEARLLQAEKMESIGRLAGGVAHDFNNMLTAIRGHADLLLLAGLDDEERDSVDEILKAVERSSFIVEQLLDYSRKRKTRAAVVHPSRAVPETATFLSQLLGERVRLAIDLDPGAGPVSIDSSQLDQIVMNLVLNARDAMPSGGEIRIASSIGPPPKAPGALVSPGEVNRWARLSVSDAGEGIPPEHRARVFEPFFTTKNAAEGIGLGLATVHGIVTDAGGTVEVESEVGRGTTFHVLLPMVEEESSAELRHSDDSSGTSGWILLVEDASPVERLVRRILEEKGMEVVCVATQRAALALLAGDGATTAPDAAASTRPDEGTTPSPDGGGVGCAEAPALLISDVTRGRLSLSAFLDRVRCLHPELSVLFLTDDSTRGAPDDDPRLRTLAKPFTPGSLANAVDELLSG